MAAERGEIRGLRAMCRRSRKQMLNILMGYSGKFCGTVYLLLLLSWISMSASGMLVSPDTGRLKSEDSSRPLRVFSKVLCICFIMIYKRRTPCVSGEGMFYKSLSPLGGSILKNETEVKEKHGKSKKRKFKFAVRVVPSHTVCPMKKVLTLFTAGSRFHPTLMRAWGKIQVNSRRKRRSLTISINCPWSVFLICELPIIDFIKGKLFANFSYRIFTGMFRYSANLSKSSLFSLFFLPFIDKAESSSSGITSLEQTTS
jgi:hypothetical protein